MKFSKLSFEQVNLMFESLQYSFLSHAPGNHPDEIDPRFTSMWHMYLLVAGWDEDEFFQELEDMEDDEHECPECAAEREATEALPAIDEKKDDAKSKAN